MKKQNPYLVFIIILGSLFGNAQPFNFGVNLAGAEFGTNMPGTFGVDYTYPTASELDYYQSKGLELIRLPFRWERLQHDFSGDLEGSELARLRDFVHLVEARNMLVLLDLHNYCRYQIGDTEEIIGSGIVSISDIRDFWTKLADEFKDEPGIWGYGIMNEPNNMPNETIWFAIAQEIINGIRTQDTETTIVVGGDSWSSAERWLEASDNLKDLIDPSDNLIFEAHVYFDNDASGQYLGTYDEEGASSTSGIERVQPFVDWLEVNGLRGFIGEYGIPADDDRWLVTLDNFLGFLADNCITGTYWAGGPWWGEYILTIEPSDGNDRIQMSIVETHITAEGSCVTTGTHIYATNDEISIYPNPFTDKIVVDGSFDNYQIRILNQLGVLVADYSIDSSPLTVQLGDLGTGLYFISILNTENAKLHIHKIVKE